MMNLVTPSSCISQPISDYVTSTTKKKKKKNETRTINRIVHEENDIYAHMMRRSPRWMCRGMELKKKNRRKHATRPPANRRQILRYENGDVNYTGKERKKPTALPKNEPWMERKTKKKNIYRERETWRKRNTRCVVLVFCFHHVAMKLFILVLHFLFWVVVETTIIMMGERKRWTHISTSHSTSFHRLCENCSINVEEHRIRFGICVHNLWEVGSIRSDFTSVSGLGLNSRHL